MISAVTSSLFILIFVCVKFLSFDGYDLIIVLTVAFVLLMLLFEYSKNAVKTPLDKIVKQLSDETYSELSAVQEKNKTQKEYRHCECMQQQHRQRH